MVFMIHDLVVNIKKHKQGKSSFEWYENASEVDKYNMLSEIYGAIGIIHRLIEQSEKYQP